MSGFLAMVRVDGSALERKTLVCAAAPLRERGPHGEALWLENNVGCAFARFVSHDGEAHQGIASLADGGKLVGHIRLDDQRSLRGVSLRSRDAQDDATLLAALVDARGAWARAGPLGDYSVAVVCSRGETPLQAWRDPLGVRLLYYVHTAEYVAASNTIEALLAVPGVSGALDHDVVADYIDMGRRAERDRTMFADIRRALPGQVLTVSRTGSITLDGTWNVPSVAPLQLRDAREYPKLFGAVLAESVSDRLRAPRVSILMSGGIDSTALAALAAERHPDGAVAIRAVTNTYRQVVRSNESEFARMAADAIGIPLVELEADDFGYLEGWDRVVERPTPAGEPDFALFYALYDAARAFGPAALSGYDGDALLEPPSIRPLLRAFSPWRVLRDALRFRLRYGRRPFLSVRGLWSRPHMPVRQWPWLRARPPLSGAHTPTDDAIISARPEMIATLRAPVWEHIFESSDAGFSRILLDVRFPFLDRRLIELVLAVPPIPWLQRKLILRDSMRDRLPDAVRTRPKTAFSGYFAGRLTQLDARQRASAWLPSEEPALTQFVDVALLPSRLPLEDVEQSLALLRVRELNDWLAKRMSAGISV